MMWTYPPTTTWRQLFREQDPSTPRNSGKSLPPVITTCIRSASFLVQIVTGIPCQPVWLSINYSSGFHILLSLSHDTAPTPPPTRYSSQLWRRRVRSRTRWWNAYIVVYVWKQEESFKRISADTQVGNFIIEALGFDKQMLCGSSGAHAAPTISVVNKNEKKKKVGLSFII